MCSVIDGYLLFMDLKKRKWFTETKYVDLATGELLPKWVFEQKYYKVRSSYEWEDKGTYVLKKYIIECRETGILKLNLWKQ